MTYLVKLQGEDYFLVEGPSGYAYGRSKAKAKKFPTEQAAREFCKILSGNVEVVTL